MREEYDRLKKQDEKLDAAKEETERLRVQLKEARDSATVAERRHQDEQQAVLDRMGRETNGKVCFIMKFHAYVTCMLFYRLKQHCSTFSGQDMHSI